MRKGRNAMMKRFVIWLIKLYKKIPGPWHGMCKYYPTCSSYAIEAIEEYGLIKGGWLAIKRICRCNPFARPGYDPVPKKDRHIPKKK
jgi:putative membrane protein insertion efficiency factor